MIWQSIAEKGLNMTVKQKDIALKTGFSLAVISRALSSEKGKSNNLSEETREHIRDIASQMGYKPNYHASCLRKGKLPVIGVFLPPWKGYLICELIMGISAAADKCGLPLNFHFDMSLDSYGKFIDSMKGNGNSGIISYVPKLCSGPNEEIINKIISYKADGGKIVFLNTLDYNFEGIPSVNVSEEHGGKLAAEYLLSKNCRHFHAFYFTSAIYTARANGFSKYLEERGIKAELKGFFGPKPGDYKEIIKAANMIFKKAPPVSAGIFATADVISKYILHEAAINRTVPGKDFHIVSYDKTVSENGPYEPPRIIQPFYDIGYNALIKLNSIIENKEEKNEILNPFLTPGVSYV